MKNLKLILSILFALTVFYVGAIFLGFNLPGSSIIQKEETISGNALLEVKLVMDNSEQDPLANVEVDVAEEPGPPPEGGRAATDASGVATFRVKPGNYFVYFNDSSFPKNLHNPGSQPITVTETGPNKISIQLSTAE